LRIVAPPKSDSSTHTATRLQTTCRFSPSESFW
jgi:hypothetical protein